jgi:transcription termination/antitermination protein NusG
VLQLVSKGPEAIRGTRWYALQVRSNTEHQVAARLRYNALEAFYPHYLAKSRDKRRDVERKFFPGYVFVRCDLKLRHPAVGIPQVVGIVGLGPNHPVPLSDSEIESVRILAASPLASVSAPCPYLKNGDKVRIKWGPLVGLEGFVLRDKRKTRIVISIDALGQSRAVEVEREAVECVVEQKRRAA